MLNLGGGDDAITLSTLDFAGIDGGDGTDLVNLSSELTSLDLVAGNVPLVRFESLTLSVTQTQTLRFSPEAVANLLGDSTILSIDSQADDTVDPGDGWSIVPPVFDVAGFSHRLMHEGIEVRWSNAIPWTNPIAEGDVNFDSDITPIDALSIINRIRRPGIR